MSTPVNRPSSPGPRLDFWVREDKFAPLFGPLTYAHADAYARTASKLNKSGRMELLTYLGARGGDPITNPPILEVLVMYTRGRKTLGGGLAIYNSDRQTSWPGLA